MSAEDVGAADELAAMSAPPVQGGKRRIGSSGDFCVPENLSRAG
ncbi:hypothetical protein [Mycobacterium sp.]